MKKTCSRCHTEKPAAEFPFRNKGKGERHPHCKACANVAARGYREAKGEYNKKYYGRTRAEILEQKREYYKRNREQIREKAARYRDANREKTRAYGRARYHADPDAARERQRQRNRQIKEAAFAAYGGARCACCGESRLAFLTIDHVNGCSKEQRRREGLGSQFYRWLQKNGYPAGYQVLCFNCNLGREVNGGVCPHREDSRPGATRAQPYTLVPAPATL